MKRARPNTSQKDLQSYQDSAERIFIAECGALKDADGSGHTPHFIDFDVQEQTSDMPYPNGYIYILLMSFVPGVYPLAIYSSLTEDDLQTIRTQLNHTLK